MLAYFLEATELIRGDKYATCGHVIPVCSFLAASIEQSAPLSTAAVELKRNLLAEMRSRLADLANNDVLLKACLLDPRYKGKYIADQSAKDRVMAEVAAAIPAVVGHEQPTAVVATRNRGSLFDVHDQCHNPTVSTGALGSDVLRRFLEEPIIPRSSCPNTFWKENGPRFPGLGEVAWRYLLPPASSVSSERMASALNLTVPSLRGRLSDEKIDLRLTLMTMPEKYWKECAL